VRVKTNVRAQAGPIVSIGEVDIMPMHYIHVPAHMPHLKRQNSWIGTFIREDKSNSIAIRYPYESCAKEHVPVLVDGPIAGESLAKMGVKASLIFATVTAAKRLVGGPLTIPLS
jgi:hypothetical protein